MEYLETGNADNIRAIGGELTPQKGVHQVHLACKYKLSMTKYCRSIN